MPGLPDCCYDYRPEGHGPQAEMVDRCSLCNEPIYEGETYYNVDGLTVCEDCIGECKQIAERKEN